MAKQSFLTRTQKFFKEVRSELRKVSWPNRKTLVSYSSVVVASVAVVSFIVWAFDTTFVQIFKFIIK